MPDNNNDEDERPISIASLKDRFESLATANASGSGPSRLPGQRSSAAATPIRAQSPAAVVPQVGAQTFGTSSGRGSGPSSSARSEVAPDVSFALSGSGQREAAAGEPDAPPISIKALRDRFAAPATSEPASLSAGPSRPISRTASPVPILAEPEPVQADVEEPLEDLDPSSHLVIVADTLSSSPAAEPVLPFKKKPPPPPPPLSRSKSPGPAAQPKAAPPAQPDRSTKPVVSRPAPPVPASAPAVTASHPSDDATLEPSRPVVPLLPARRQTLIPPTSSASTSAPPPIPANRPSVDRPPNGSNTAGPAIESPPLPSRSRAATVSARAERPATPPRLPNRSGTLGPASGLPLPPSRTTGPPLVSAPQPSQSLPPRPQPPLTGASPGKSQDSTPLADGAWLAPPPPTRNPAGPTSTPPQRQATRSSAKSGSVSPDEDDEDEKDGGPALTATAKRMLDEYPDTTNANKRPPAYLPDIRLSGTHNIYSFAAFGRYVCLGAHHVRVFDVQMSDRPLFTVDLHHTGLELRVKDPRVTALCFRPALDEADEGRYLWCGTKDGHLWELDIKTGQVTDTRAFAHASSVSHIFRWKKHIMSLEENGKLHLYDLQMLQDSDPSRIPEVCRTVRLADRFTFARMLRHQLWTSTGPANRSTTNTAGSRGPTIRVYEPCAEGTMPQPATVYATEWTGAVTAATALPLKPEEVYLAHEGGYVSIWNTEDLTCLSVLKISASDIISMEGVGHKLWHGNRKGQISVYDVSQKPWQATNIWTAHPEQPVQYLYVDPWAIEHADRFTCWSLARDTIHAWDGLLAVDWLDRKMEERQADFCAFRDIKVLVCTWNIDSAKPSDLSGSEANAGFLDELMSTGDSPDVVVFGFQEVIPLMDKKLTAKTLLFGKDKGASGALSDKVSMAYRQWQDKLQQGIRRGTQAGDGYVRVHSESLVGLLTCVFVKQSQQYSLRDLAITTVKRGIGGIYGNKGAIVARLVMDDTSMCFINVHLAAGQSSKVARNADIAAIMEDKAILPPQDPLPYAHGGDGTGIMDHEIVIINGDMNYRIDQRRDNVISSVYANDFAFLLEHDQLRKELKTNRAFRLRSFDEAPITFAPTYKYDRRSDDYDTSEKRRVPAWCDRILFSKSDKVQCLDYRRYETDVSDHRPVSATLRVRLKAMDDQRMMKVKTELRHEWGQVEAELLSKLSSAFAKWERA